MKIKIGPYTNWVGAYQLADLLQYLGFSEDRCYKIGEYLSNTWVQTFCEWIDSFKKRNIKIHIDNYDIWSGDSTLALIILPILQAIEELRSINAPPKENEWDWDDLVFDRWNWVLDEMIWTFTQLQPDCDWEQQYYSGVIDMDFKRCEDTPLLMEMVDGPNHTWKVDKVGLDAHNARINNGLRLFSRYFRALWT